MNADGSDAGPLTNNPVIEESPDWQPIPISVGATNQSRTACGDLSLLPGGISSVVAIKTSCDRALRLASRWLPGARFDTPRTRGNYKCNSEPHSFDQVLVQCDHRGAKKAIAFVYREPPAAPVLDVAD
jgi:hypothetical protein